MKWEDKGYVLSSRKYSERDALVTVFTHQHGLWRALVKGGVSSRQRGMLEPGNLLQISWNARLAEHLGTFSCELLTPYAAIVMQNRMKLALLSSVCALLEGVLQERDPHPALFEETYRMMERLGDISPLLRGEGQGEKPQPLAHIDAAKELRQTPTEAEKKMWHTLRQKQLGVKFRRQQPIGKYIVDFVCFEIKLIIELDDGQHNWQRPQDNKRTAYLEAEGYQLLRFWNHEVMQNMEGVLLSVQDFLKQHPSPAGGDAFGHLLPSREGITERYCRFELSLLAEAGYGLDLSACAATGGTQNLAYISPKTGRAVSREAGAPYHDRLLPFPLLFAQENYAVKPAEILDALRVTGYFLQAWQYAPQGKKLPAARERLVELIERGSRLQVSGEQEARQGSRASPEHGEATAYCGG